MDRHGLGDVEHCGSPHCAVACEYHATGGPLADSCDTYTYSADLSRERIAERAVIVYEVDAAACAGCGRAVPDSAVVDPAWFIDSEQVPSASCAGEVDTLAVIRCPACW